MFEPSKASTAQFDVREDEEQYTTMVEILELLISAGYFRAKIQGLSAFDKIVGGMVWCISLCAESVDVDLLYSENSTIGQKIALTENIVKVLPRFKCPHALEPHQIQGLDCIHILPVMRWLVKEAIEAKKRTGDEILNHAAFQFRQAGWKLDQFESQNIDRGEKVKPKRIYRRADRLQSLDIEEDVKCTLMEYGHEASDVVVLPEMDEGEEKKKKEREQILEKDLRIAERLKAELQDANEEAKVRMSARVVNDLLDSSSLDNIASEDRGTGLRSVGQLRSELEQLETEQRHLKTELVEEENKFNRLTNEKDKLFERFQDYQDTLANLDPEKLEELKTLLADTRESKAKYRAYKRQCREAIGDMDSQIAELEAMEPGTTASIDQLLEDEHSHLVDELMNLDSELNQSNQALFQLRCQVDANPSQLEKNQYQKRFIELYNHISSKHREIKGLYTMHNTKVDVRNLLRKEIDLLNNIDDLKDKAVKDAYKQSFVQNLDGILKNVEGSLEKMTTRKEALQKEKNKLYDKLQLLVDKQRVYNSAVADFQKACLLNQQLRENMAKAKSFK